MHQTNQLNLEQNSIEINNDATYHNGGTYKTKSQLNLQCEC